MDAGRLARIGIWLALSAIFFVWRRHRKRKRFGKLLSVGRLVGSRAPYRAVYGIVNYALSNFVMILVSANEGDYLVGLGFAVTLVLSLAFQIKDFRDIWNKVFVYEGGIEVNYREIPRKMMKRLERGPDGLYVCEPRFGRALSYEVPEEGA